MRLLWAMASLTFLWSLCGPHKACGDDKAAPKMHWQKPIVGLGETEETAQRDAIVKAKEQVDAMWITLRPLVKSSEITEDDVKSRFLSDPGSAGDDINIEGFPQPFKRWIVTLRPESERLLRARDRQTLSSVGMVGLAILLVAGFGYIRLDEYTQRKYTTWLRVAGLGVVTSAIAGWWVVAR